MVESGASVVSIAAAEAKRRADNPVLPAVLPRINLKQVGYVLGGIALLAAAGGVLGFVLTRTHTVPVAAVPQAPYISVDDTLLVQAPTPLTRDALMSDLTAAKAQVRLPLGLIEWLYPSTQAQDGTLQGLTSAQFIQALAPNVPAELVRTLQPAYVVGVHSYDENQAFILLGVDSYSTAYAAMLQWERTLATDLLPLFARNPSPHIQTGVQVDTSSTTPQEPVFTPGNFVDKVVENRDTRVLLNAQGDIVLLWTFFGRNIILITTNDATLREVVSRMNIAPSVQQPGQ